MLSLLLTTTVLSEFGQTFVIKTTCWRHKKTLLYLHSAVQRHRLICSHFWSYILRVCFNFSLEFHVLCCLIKYPRKIWLINQWLIVQIVFDEVCAGQCTDRE